MPQLPIPAIAGGGTLHFTWSQPTDSTLDESLGDGQRAVVQPKVKGDPSTRFAVGAAFLEYAVRAAAVSGKHYVARALPWAYQGLLPPSGSAVASKLDANLGDPLYASRILTGKGMGPAGQAAPANSNAGAGTGTSIPLYEYYIYSLECTTRNYAILPDSAVLGPGSIDAAWHTANDGPPGLGVATLANPPFGVSANKLFPAGSYTFFVTALSADGETTPVNTGVVVIGGGAGMPNIYGVEISWSPILGALGYKLYRQIGADPATCVWVVTPLGANAISYITTGVEPNVVAVPPVVDTTASPLFNGGGATQLPDEGAALAASDGSSGERYVVRSREDFTQFQQVSRGHMLFCDTGFSTTEGIATIIPFTEAEYTWMGVPVDAIPWDNIRRLEGCVSVTSFDGNPPWTALFKGAKEPEFRRSALGLKVCDLTYRFECVQAINVLGIALGKQAALEFTGGNVGPANGYRFGLDGQVDWSVLNSDRNGHGQFLYRFCQSFAALFRSPL